MQPVSARPGAVPSILAWALIGSLTVAAALFLANFSLTFVPREHYRSVAAEAFRSGGLPLVLPAPTPSSAPKYNNNDCLIMGLLLANRSGENRIQRAVSPRMPFGLGSFAKMCEEAARAVAKDPTASLHYHNYIHGNWTLARALLLVTSFAGATTLLWGTGLLFCLGLIVLNIAAYARTHKPRHAAFASLGLAALLFTGRGSYGWSMSFAPSDIVIFSFLIAWSLGRGPDVRGAAFLGALTAAFEFLTGALPVAAALLLMSCAFHEDDGREMRALKTFAAFSLAVLLMFVLKAVAVALAFEPVAVTVAGTRLLSWAGTAQWGIDAANAAKLSVYGISADSLKESRATAFLFALAKMAYFSPTLVFGSLAGGIAVTVLLPLGLASFGLIRLLKGDRDYWLILAAPAVIMGWYFVMLSHTIVHAHFMVRVLAWLGCLTVAFFGWLVARHRVTGKGMVDALGLEPRTR
jgi:hypothetical protein